MTHLYHAQIEISSSELLLMSSKQTVEFEEHCRRRLASEFFPFIMKNMKVSKIAANFERDCGVFRASVVMMPLEEYRRLTAAAGQVDDRYRGLSDYHFEPASQCRVPKPEPKKEFDGVDYLKQLMMKGVKK